MIYAPAGRVGSVFLSTHDNRAAANVLALMVPGVTIPGADSVWYEIAAGDVSLFLEQVPADQPLPGGRFGLLVPDAEAAHHAVAASGLAEVSELFEVSPGQRGFDVNHPAFGVFFVHE